MNDNLNACLQHFWGSSYWSQELEKLPELSSEVKSILLAKSAEIDRLRYQLSAAQQSAQADKCPVCLGEKGAFVDGHWTDCIHCLATGEHNPLGY